MRDIQPTLFVFAGNNGSGKSTVRNLIADKIGINTIIDPDSLNRKYRLQGERKPELKAAKEAISLIDNYIIERRNFSMETTLSGKLSLKQLKKAKSYGFEVIMFFVGLKSVDLNVERVRQRVESGGHHIPNEDILRREDRVIDNLIYHIQLIDQIVVIDNSNKDAKILMERKNNQLLFVSDELPDWARKIANALKDDH